MVRTKTKKMVAPSAAVSMGTAPPRPIPSVASLVAKGKELIGQCDYDLALRFIRRALDREPNNAEARELLGITELERGELENASQAFLSLIPPSTTAPNPPPASAYLYLAQLSDENPRAALGYFNSAVEVLQPQLKGKDRANGDADSDETEIRATIVRALIGMVEIWMSDLCFEPDAEQNCDSLLEMALKTDPQNAEALQTLASVRISQSRPDEAKKHLEQAWSTWNQLEPDDPALPPIPSRLSLARLFLELQQYTLALSVIQGILASDDQEVEAWYLEGWCFFLLAEKAKETGEKVEELGWAELSRDALDCLEACQALHTSQGHPDKQILQHVQELIAELKAAGVTPSPADADDVEDSDNGDGQGSDGDVDME